MVEQEQNSETKYGPEIRQWHLDMIETYVNRKDCIAFQTDSGSYYCKYVPVTPELIHEHLCGRCTLGVYTLSKESTAKYVVLDADNEENYVKLGEIFKSFEAPSYLEQSRRGGHLWFFFEEPIEGKLARNFGLRIAEMFSVQAEVFPKQTVSKGPGSCIRLPFGTHLKSHARYYFPGFASREEELVEMANPARRVNLETIKKYQYEEPKERKWTKQENDMLPLWEAVKRNISVYQLVSMFVELDKKGKGHCPFHSDDKPSFSVNIKDNYWHCFAGCGGGSVIDFWMKLNNMEFDDAVRDMAERLGFGGNGFDAKRDNDNPPGSRLPTDK